MNRLLVVLLFALLSLTSSPSVVCAQVTSVRTSSHTVYLYGNLRSFKPLLGTRTVEQGLDLITLTLESSSRDTLPAGVTLAFSHPIIDVQSNWHPSMLFSRHLRITWQEGFFSNSTHDAPLMIAHNANGENKLTFACSDAVSPITVRMGVNEETSSLECKAELFGLHGALAKTYSLELRIDTRPKPLYETLDDCRKWYEQFYPPMPVPNVGRLPFYSSWYSFHKALNADTLLLQCRVAKSFGCDAVIIDDGWQTTDARSIYEDCGDWEVQPEIFPDLKKTVEQIHALGMKVLLWYAVPFAGVRSKAAQTFKDKMLYTDWGLRTHVFDVRFPDVREHIISRLEDGVKQYDLDGLKLDFIDMLRSPNLNTTQIGNGRDYESVEEATVKLMSDIRTRLEKIKPDLMIEFRQSYISPVMRRYGNLFRAGDCANDAIENRVRTIDIRLLSGATAVHSDMLTWNVNEPVELAADQITNVLFSVPQLSNRFEKLPNEHSEMIRYWLRFWREHRDVLLDGDFRPKHPELNYPMVIATTNTKRIIALYADMVINPEPNVPNELYLINGSHKPSMVLKLESPLGTRTIEVRDCKGNLVRTERKILSKGVHQLDVPLSGVVKISKP
jgi:alpha-galactosidase